jgi:hypothetical protein
MPGGSAGLPVGACPVGKKLPTAVSGASKAKKWDVGRECLYPAAARLRSGQVQVAMRV